MSPKGVRIEKGEPVERMASEGPLDQNLGISIDENQANVVFLDSVTDENDVFNRCPVVGDIDCEKGLEGKSIRSALEGVEIALSNLYLNPTGTSLADYGSGPTTDKFGVTDGKWIDEPHQLIWKSALLAQLQAKHNALAHFLNDPSVADFGKTMSDEERKLVAQRARQLAAELQDAALNEICDDVDGAGEKLKQSVASTKERFLRYVVTQEDAIKEGGLTESEVDELFEEGR
jgi:hypothetical protein